MPDPLAEHFPLPTYRPHQRETIIRICKAYADGYESVVLESPTGTGKSVIAMTVASILGRSYFITIQRILQTQYVNDFGQDGRLIDLKGRSSFECWLINTILNPDAEKKIYAHRGRCVALKKSKLPQCEGKCPYFNRVLEAQLAPHTLFNFSSFLFQRQMARRFLDARKLLVVDEAHQCESQIMEFVEVVICGDDFSIKLPEFESAKEYAAYFQSIDLGGLIKTRVEHYSSADVLSPEEIQESEKWESIGVKYRSFLDYIEHVDCVAEFADNAVTIKPLRANYHAPKLLFNAGRHKLLMSATILNYKIFCRNVGLDLSKTKFISLPSIFPIKNRPIYLDYAGSMNYKSKKETMPKLIKKVDEIMSKYPGERGIIHCQSFQIMHDVAESLSSKNRARIVHQRMFRTKEEMLAAHAANSGSVIIAPAMHEGLDLKQELARFAVIAKVPYPDITKSKQLQIRVKESWSYYMWLTALRCVQAYGRSVRSESDWAHTYIIDADFDKFFHMADSCHVLPTWFIEAIDHKG